MALALFLFWFYDALSPATQAHPRVLFFLALLPRVAEALILAVILAFLVDIAAKKELLKEFLEDTSFHIIGRQLPEDIREEIRGYLNPDFIRPSWTLVYRIEEIASNSGAIKLKSFFTGEIENRSSKVKDFTFIGEVDDTWLDGVGKAQIVHAAVVKKDGTEIFDLSFDEEANTHLTASAGIKPFHRVIQVPPAQPPLISILECIEYLPSSYVYPLVSAGTVSRATLTVYYPKLKFKVEVSLSSGDESKVHRSEFIDGSIWDIRKPLLPGQCVMTNWQRIPTQNGYFAGTPAP